MMAWFDDLYNLKKLRQIRADLKDFEELQFQLALDIDEVRMWIIKYSRSIEEPVNIDNILLSDDKEMLEAKHKLLDTKLKHHLVTRDIKAMRIEKIEIESKLGVF
jgi:hypothetical protein